MLELLSSRYGDMDPKEVLKKLLGKDVTTDEPVDRAARGVVTGEQGGRTLACYLLSLYNAGDELFGEHHDEGVKAGLEAACPPM